MGITFQLFAVSPVVLDRFIADSQEAEQFIQDRYCEDIAGESLWLDKSGMGIMEAFGVHLGEGDPPAAWIFGDGEMSVGEIDAEFAEPCAFLTPEQVADVARWISGISDAQFTAMAASNEMNADVDYLAHFFGRLRDFYQEAASSGKATFTYIGI